MEKKIDCKIITTDGYDLSSLANALKDGWRIERVDTTSNLLVYILYREIKSC